MESIQARLEEYFRDPFIATYYQFNKIDLAGDFSGLGERVFTREEIEMIIYQSAIITRKPLLIYYPPEEPRHRDLEVSPTFGRVQPVSIKKPKTETVTESRFMIRISNPRKASDLSSKSTPRRTIPSTGGTGHEDYTMEATTAGLVSSDTKNVATQALSTSFGKSVTAQR